MKNWLKSQKGFWKCVLCNWFGLLNDRGPAGPCTHTAFHRKLVDRLLP